MSRRTVMRSSLDSLRADAQRHAEMQVEARARIYRLNPCPLNHRHLGDAFQNLLRRSGGRWNGRYWHAP